MSSALHNAADSGLDSIARDQAAPVTEPTASARPALEDQVPLADTDCPDRHEDQAAPQLDDARSSPSQKSKASGRRDGRGVGKVLTLEHLIGAASGWLVMAVARAIRGKQRRLHVAQGELEAARVALAAKEAALEEAMNRELQIQGEAESQASAAATAAEELARANVRCEEAAKNLEKTMGDLQSTREELLAAKDQLQAAMDEMSSVRARGEAAEGELGLTRSENELLKRELQRMRNQLDGATHALERHRQGVRVAHTRDDNTSTWVDDGLSGAEDDRSSLGGYGSD